MKKREHRTEPRLTPPVSVRRKDFDDPKTEVGRASGATSATYEANVILIAHPENQMLGQRFRMSPGSRLEIGRSTSCEIPLPDVLSVSRNHARLEYAPDAIYIEDLGSTNGTYINDDRVELRSPLRSGDRFQVGTVHFKFLHEQDVENAYHEAIHNLMMRDGLTGAYNRRKYEEEASRELARAIRYGRPLALVLFDIDLFKSVNDSHGHLCGDFVLHQIAVLANEMLRTEQIFARVGGEEFAILSPETDTEGARLLSERLRESIAGHEFQYAEHKLAVTCSFGVAELRAGMDEPQDLYAAADRALYAAKDAGRNTVCIDGSGNGA